MPVPHQQSQPLPIITQMQQQKELNGQTVRPSAQTVRPSAQNEVPRFTKLNPNPSQFRQNAPRPTNVHNASLRMRTVPHYRQQLPAPGLQPHTSSLLNNLSLYPRMANLVSNNTVTTVNSSSNNLKRFNLPSSNLIPNSIPNANQNFLSTGIPNTMTNEIFPPYNSSRVSRMQPGETSGVDTNVVINSYLAR